ncbi:hypothetical protein PSCICM_06290 [Pseudomonas cichorii]|uniref:Uncharacterized protein n=1 Tax=Pseudomonas cichorii TaxID=36746 RepID=A0ABQ1DRH6_PSECI|nr:hypothetical protein PSCICM_06290 [Pseudomonas cichorii]GFM93589.1 hypothetical protein PSCICP_35610 [Pseudomonas cichorii]
MRPTVTIEVKVGKHLEKIEISSRISVRGEFLSLFKGVYCLVIVRVEKRVQTPS